MIDHARQFMKVIFTIALLLGCSLSLVAQATAFQCTPFPEVSNYRAWLDSTDLSKNVPYRIDSARESTVRAAYANIEIGMSRSAVEKVMGKPEFENVMTGGPKGKPATSCIDQWVYVFRKNNAIPIDPEDAAIYLTFGADGQLYWASPQNIPLKPKGSAVRK
jgi:hypothetical protein